ncbi:Mini-chromosome maintenance complex-binding protein [Plasmodiophora brassicae]|uniref:Mini-chromosome maintenance complex-binding protein n=1 Tax=Plasmodiophora brassicae TaxID=37360 RepID=A0A0G4IRB1_PLABS|nr:hypothetical protein PBRA_005919 [Plasmodiophora brassicae]SPQ98350.1 unnamed protein product [Plasmodiophora brassicae]
MTFGERDLDAVARAPLGVIDEAFARASRSEQAEAEEWGETALLQAAARQLRRSLPDGEGALVRVRGLITSTAGNEFYMGVYRDGNGKLCTGKYRDRLPPPSLDADDDARVFVRELAILAPIPHSAPWAGDTSVDVNTIIKFTSAKDMPKVGDAVDIVGIRGEGLGQQPVVHCVHYEPFEALDHLDPERVLTQSVEEVRNEIIAFLGRNLGCTTAGEYLLLHMVSRVHSRPRKVCIGSLPLHFRPMTDEATSVLPRRILELYQLLRPHSTMFPLSIASLTSPETLCPRMDYETDVLVPGPLQLASGTALIVDQTVMTEGNLPANALANLRTINSIAHSQVLAYNFMYDVEFSVDIPVLVVAPESKTLVHTVRSVAVGTTAPVPESAVVDDVDEDTLSRWRLYLSTARQMNVEIPSEIATVAERDFVDNKTSESGMHSALNLARLLSASRFESVMSRDSWARAFALLQA